jgi:site-specific DNA-methyltransferase (adenine-specific)
MSYAIHHADFRTFLAGEPAGKYDLLLTDSPYYTTNLAFDKAPQIDYEREFWPEAWRVLKTSGVVVMFAADLFTVDLLLSQRKAYRYRLVWEKNSATNFLSANRRPMSMHEDILIFCQQPGESTYNAQKRVGKPYKSHRKNSTKADHYGGHEATEYGKMYGAERHPGTVLAFDSPPPCGPGRYHPTQKPVDLLRWLIRAYSNPGDTVLDCFAGSGSTLEACLAEGRYGVGCELDATYYAKANARLQAIANTPQLAF